MLRALCMAAALALGAGGACAAHAAKAPNVVVIVADDLGWNAVGYHGGFVETPHIDRIAAQGVQLDRFYVSPMCSPTRVGLMTGRYALRLGMGRTVVRPWYRYGLPPEEQTLAEALGAAGYAHRGAFGKWHLGHLAPQWHPLSQGFTEFTGCYNGAADYWTRLREGEVDWHDGGEPLHAEGYTTDLIAEAACDFIERHAGEAPFFCYVPFTAPHEPLQAPQALVDRYAPLDGRPEDGRPSPKQVLAAMIASLDEGVGRILEAIDRGGAARDTIVWFFSDNGGIGRIRGNNRPLRGAKLSVYEGGVRVPAAVWWPGRIEGGRKVETPIMNIDVMPTLLALAGAKADASKEFDGVDVSAALMAAESAAPAGRDLYFFTGQNGIEDEQLAVTTADGWKLVMRGPDVSRAGGVSAGSHEVELFNVLDDPREEADRAREHPEIVASLIEKAVAFRRTEPEDAMPLAPPPRGFRPPKAWRNAPSAEPGS